MFSNGDEVLKFIKDEGVEFVDVRFCDLPGVMQHFNVPAASVGADFFSDGQMFDGSSIRGFQAINESDMKLIPDVRSAYLDPFRVEKTLIMNLDDRRPVHRRALQPRPAATSRSKAEAYLKSTGIADTAYFGAEAEFYIFDDVRFETKQNAGYYFIDSIEAAWNTGRVEEGGNRGLQDPLQGGLLPRPAGRPLRRHARQDLPQPSPHVGIKVERSHHEVGTAGQAGDQLPVLHAGSARATTCHEVQVRRSRTPWLRRTARPRPSCRSRSSATTARACTPTSRSGRTASRSSTPSRGYGGLSDLARWYVGGLLQARPLAAGLHQPDGQLLPPARPGLRGPGQPRLLGAQPLGLRPHPHHRAPTPKAKRIEFRIPDPSSSNPYLSFAAHADGRSRRHQEQASSRRRARSTRTSTSSRPRSTRTIKPRCPGSLPAVLDALEADHDYLSEGGVFTEDLIDTWIELKRTQEVDPIRLRPHPHEFELYYDI